MTTDTQTDLIAALKDLEARFVSTPQQALLLPGLGDVRKSIAQAIHAFKTFKEIYTDIKRCRKDLMDASQQAEQLRVLLNQALTVLRFSVSQLSFDHAPESLSEVETEHLKTTISRFEALIFDLMRQGQSLHPVNPVQESLSAVLTDIVDQVHKVNQASRIYEPREGKLLILDQDLTTAESLQRRLAHEGYEVMRVTEPDIATALLVSGSVDVILADIQAAEETYAPLMQEVLGRRVGGYIPVIVIGELSQLEFLSQYLERGADDFLIKPLNTAVLKARIRSNLEKKAAYEVRQDQLKACEKMKEELHRAIHAFSGGFIAFDHRGRATLHNDKLYTFFPHLRVLLSPHQDGIILEDILNSILEAGVIDLFDHEHQAWYLEKLEALMAPAQVWEEQLLSGKIYQFTSCRTADGGIVLTLQDVSEGKGKQDRMMTTVHNLKLTSGTHCSALNVNET